MGFINRLENLSVLSAKKMFTYKNQERRWKNNQIQNRKPYFDIPDAIRYKSTTSCGRVAVPLPWNWLGIFLAIGYNSYLVTLVLTFGAPDFSLESSFPVPSQPFQTSAHHLLPSERISAVSIFLSDRVVHLFCDSRCLYDTYIPSDITLQSLLNWLSGVAISNLNPEAPLFTSLFSVNFPWCEPEHSFSILSFSNREQREMWEFSAFVSDMLFGACAYSYMFYEQY